MDWSFYDEDGLQTDPDEVGAIQYSGGIYHPECLPNPAPWNGYGPTLISSREEGNYPDDWKNVCDGCNKYTTRQPPKGSNDRWYERIDVRPLLRGVPGNDMDFWYDTLKPLMEGACEDGRD